MRDEKPPPCREVIADDALVRCDEPEVVAVPRPCLSLRWVGELAETGRP